MPKDPQVKSLHLRDLPIDVVGTIWDRQNELKRIAGRHVSQEKAFCRIVREYKEMKEREGKK